MLGLGEGQIRVISPDVGGGFGYKCVLHPEEVCVAWLALTHKRPFRYVEDRREHLIAGANSRQHHYKLKAYADERGSVTIEHVGWAVAVIAIVGIVVAAIKTYVTSESGKIK